MTWVGTNLEGRIANLRGWRYSTFDGLPNTWLKEIVADKAPLWTAPPRGLSEIKTLRATAPPIPSLGFRFNHPNFTVQTL